MRICRVRVEEKEEFLVYTVLWTLTCHPYLESATALSDKNKINTDRFVLTHMVSQETLCLGTSMAYRTIIKQ